MLIIDLKMREDSTTIMVKNAISQKCYLHTECKTSFLPSEVVFRKGSFIIIVNTGATEKFVSTRLVNYSSHSERQLLQLQE